MSMDAQPINETDSPTLDALLKDVQSLEGLVTSWDEQQQNTYQALREAHDALSKEAFSRLIRALKTDSGAMALLKEAMSDEVIYAVLRHHGIVKPSIQERLEEALDSVRPYLASHGGNVEIVDVLLPDTVVIRLLGACDGCPASSLTLSEGVEKAIKEYCPEITTIKKAKGGVTAKPAANGEIAINFISPFARKEDKGWIFACDVAEIPDNQLLVTSVQNTELILYQTDSKVVCYQNSCAHMGMPLDMGTLEQGTLTCPHHGFQFLLESGECLTAPEVQLHTHAVRIVGDTVEIKLL